MGQLRLLLRSNGVKTERCAPHRMGRCRIPSGSQTGAVYAASNDGPEAGSKNYPSSHRKQRQPDPGADSNQ